MAGQAVGAMQRQMLIELRQAQKSLQRRFLHARHVAEAHVILDQRQNLFGLVVRKAQAPANFFRDLHANLDVVIEADAIRRHAKRRGLAHIVQQRSPRQRHRARLRQMIEQQQRVHKHIAFGMELRRLLHALHRRNFRQHMLEQAAFIQQKKRTPPVAFRQHAGQFIAHPLARHNLDLLRQFLHGRKRRRLDRVFEPRREAHGAQHAQLVFRKPLLRIADRADDSRLADPCVRRQSRAPRPSPDRAACR